MRITLDAGARLPEKAHTADAGYDLFSPEFRFLAAQTSVTINTGVHVEIPEGYVGMIKSRSGLNIFNGITTEGVIDAGYTGSIKVKMYNNSDEDYEVHIGDKISQLVVMPILLTELEVVDSLESTERGDNGFGSSGR